MSDKQTSRCPCDSSGTAQGVCPDPVTGLPLCASADCYSTRRASEGQAQTSAAVGEQPVWILSDENDEPIMTCPKEPTEQLRLEVSAKIGLGVKCKKYLLRPADASQLADSTAPGAPADRNAVLEEAAQKCADMQVEFNRDDYSGQSIGARCCATEIRALKSAAPTAQQSLTAGGAVPDGGLLPCPFCGGDVTVFGGHNNNPASVNCNDCDSYGPSARGSEAATIAWNRRSAAQLMQVQAQQKFCTMNCSGGSLSCADCVMTTACQPKA